MNDDQKQLSGAAGAIYFVGGMSVVVGIIAVLFDIQFLKSLGLGFWSILGGGVFLFLGYKVKNGSSLALYVAIALYSLEFLFAIMTLVKQKMAAGTGGLVFRGYLLYLMIRGIGGTEHPQPASSKTLPAASMPPKAPAHAPRLTGEAERQRMEMSSLSQAKLNKPAPMPGDLRRFDVSVKDSVTTAASSLRFVAYRCEISPTGFKAIYGNGQTRELNWRNVASIVTRQLPADKPWESKVFLDVIPASAPGFPVAPIRIFAATFVNYAALPGGQAAGTTENIRRLAAYMVSQNPSVIVDPASVGFVQQQRAPHRFVNLAQFVEYDSRYKE